jgi:TP901 family phage tail tape measure protein
MAGGTVVVRFVGDVREFQASARRLQGILQGVQRAVGLSFGLMAADALRSALQFDQAFARIDAISNASAKEIAGFREQVLKLSGETARAPAELANAMFFLSSSGLSARQAVEALEASAKAAAVGLGATEDIAKVVANALNAYADAGLTAKQATDTLVAAVREGSAEPADFADALGRILPIASQAQVGFDEVTASLAALSNIGLDVNEGVTAMRGLLQALVAPGSQAAETLTEVGISADEMRRVLSEQGLLAALRLLEERTGGNIDLMKRIVPNVRALTGAFGLTVQEAEKVNGIFERVTRSSGSLDEAFRTMEQTASFRVARALQQLRTAAQELASKVLPPLADVLEKVANNAELVLTALLGWQALKFLPGLLHAIAEGLFSVALGLESVGLKAAAAKLTSLAAGISTVAKASVATRLSVIGLAAMFVYAGSKANELADQLGVTEETLHRMPSAGRSGVSAAFELARRHQEAAQRAAELAQANENMAARWEAAARTMTGATDKVIEKSQELASQVGKTRKQIKVFAGMTKAEFKDWAKSVGEDLRDVSGVFADLVEDGKVTAREIIRSFRKQAEALANYRENWETVIKRGLPDALAQQIADMGLDGASILQELANASDQRFREIVRAFKEAQRQAKRTEQAIRGVGQAVNALPSHKTMTISVEIQKSALAAGAGGHGVQLQHGGVVTRPTFALIGEAGPEAVIPLSRLREVRETTREVAPRRVDVRLIVDRRRFTEQQKIAYVWER